MQRGTFTVHKYTPVYMRLTRYANTECNVKCIFSDLEKNLALEGKAYMSASAGRMYRFADETLPGVNVPAWKLCPITEKANGAWWRVDFTKLIEVNTVEITPGKF